MKRKKNLHGFHKRARGSAANPSLLISIRNTLQYGDYPTALAAIDQAVAGTTDTGAQSELLALVGDCLFRQGKYAEAASTYAQVYQLVASQPLFWLRPAIGQIRSLLKNVQVADAQTKALAALQNATNFYQQYQTQLAQALATVAAGGQAAVPAEPTPPAKVAARLGKIFFTEGEVAIAKNLFQQAVALDANNLKALLGLAEIAVRENDSATAIANAKTALAVNHYHAETLSAWKLLLDAGRKSGADVLDAALLGNLTQSPAGVRARATLLIVKNLRGQSDARWQTISNDWLALPGAKDKIIVAELRKLNLAHARITNPTPAAKRQLAQAVLNTPGISPGEWLAATKQVITTKFAQNQTPDMETRLTDGAAMFGAAFRPQFTHGLALACQKAGRADLATTLFQSNVNNADASTEQKNKSLWALARLQSAQGDHAGAAQSFWSYSQNVNVPQRFAAYALVQWVTELAATNQPGLMAQAKPKIEAVLPQITDYELLLDLARKVFNLRTGDASWFSFSRQIFQRGQQVALQAFNAASEPSVAAGILFKLCRRASTDFHDHATVLAVWSQLTDTKKLWLWSEQQDYWYLQELVFRAYRDGGQATAAEQFITPLLNDPATPPTGLAILGTSYAVLKRNQKDLPAMFAAYEKVTQAAPAHEWSSSAYYWFALRAWNQGSATQAATYADKLLQVLSGSVELYWKKDYTAAAWLLKAGLQPAQVPVQANLAATVLQKQLQVMQTDLALLNA